MKFTPSLEAAEDFLAGSAAWLHREIYDLTAPVAYSRTTYLDTPDHRDHRAALASGLSSHLRVRQYAAAEDSRAMPRLTGRAFLELKRRGGGLREKIRFAAPPQVIESMLAGRHELDELSDRRAGDDPRLAALLRRLDHATLAPVVAAWYRRRSFVAAGGRVRVTLDEGITYGRPGPLGRAGDLVAPTRIIGHGPACVLEVKCLGAPPLWLGRALAGLPAASDLSKFRDAMTSLACAA